MSGKGSGLGNWIPRRHRQRAFRWLKGAVHRVSGEPGGSAVIFVAGVQRSGTNMIMDVLDRSFETDAYHETDHRAFENYEMKDIEVVKGLHQLSRAPVFVIKSLCELQDLPGLLEQFAPAKAVWVVRDYRDVVNSMLKSFPSQKAVIERLAEDPGGNRWTGRGMSEETHQLLRGFVETGVDDAGGAALIWYLRNVLFFERALERDSRVMLVSYEELVSTPVEQFRRVYAFCGLRYRESMAAGIFSSSIRKREGPSIAPEIVALCDGLLQRFADARIPGEREGGIQ